jgi:hypothetical protein
MLPAASRESITSCGRAVDNICGVIRAAMTTLRRCSLFQSWRLAKKACVGALRPVDVLKPVAIIIKRMQGSIEMQWHDLCPIAADVFRWAGERQTSAVFPPIHRSAMFWTFDRLQLFVWAAKIRNKRACSEGMETMPLHDPTQPLLKERAEREARRVRLWCERKDAVWDAMQTENARARDAWTSTVRPRR